MSQALDALITKLDAASEGSRELDARIHAALHWLDADEFAFWPEQHVYIVRRGEAIAIDEADANYTTSVDAALTLVPEGAVWHAMTDYGNLNRAKIGPAGRPSASVYRVTKNDDRFIQADAATPALALCIAAIRVRSTTGGGE